MFKRLPNPNNQMRLSAHERKIIRSEILNVDPNGKIFLFGSRVDDLKRGGDIDLFVATSYQIDYRKQLLLEHLISSALDTQIDLLFQSPDDKETTIHQIAKRGIRL